MVGIHETEGWAINDEGHILAIIKGHYISTGLKLKGEDLLTWHDLLKKCISSFGRY